MVYSSRRLAQACEERVDFMAVSGLPPRNGGRWQPMTLIDNAPENIGHVRLP